MVSSVKKLLLIALTIVAASAGAQEKYFYATLDVTTPLSNKDWIESGSARGFRVGYRGFINDKFSAGIDVGSATYDQYKPTETVELPTGAITTDYFNYLYTYSAVISGQYNFAVGDREIFFPYAGIGVGANYNEYVKFYNIYDDRENAWGFLARPEAGILVKFGQRRSIGAMAAVHFDYSTNRSEMFGYNNFHAAGFQIGLMFLEL